MTLTHKRAILTPDGLYYAATQDYARNLRHFLTVVEAKLFGRTNRRRGEARRKVLRRFVVQERDGNGRFHYHLLIDNPTKLPLVEFRALVIETWQRTEWGYQQVDVQPAVSDGWVHYITKRAYAGKQDTIDLENTELQA